MTSPAPARRPSGEPRARAAPHWAPMCQARSLQGSAHPCRLLRGGCRRSRRGRHEHAQQAAEACLLLCCRMDNHPAAQSAAGQPLAGGPAGRQELAARLPKGVHCACWGCQKCSCVVGSLICGPRLQKELLPGLSPELHCPGCAAERWGVLQRDDGAKRRDLRVCGRTRGESTSQVFHLW